jgi:hypothetical protein
MVRVLALSAPRESAVAFGRVRLRITWDGRQAPSVDAPLALFYGAGTLYNRDDREYLVKAFPVSVRFDAERVYLACYFPMPFFCSARVEPKGDGPTSIAGVRWSVRERNPLRRLLLRHSLLAALGSQSARGAIRRLKIAGRKSIHQHHLAGTPA